MSDHLCDWCHGLPTERVVVERAVWDGRGNLKRRAIYAFACADHAVLGLADGEEAAPAPATNLRRRKDRSAVQTELFPDERAAGDGYGT